MSTWEIKSDYDLNKVNVSCKRCGFKTTRLKKHVHESKCPQCKQTDAINKLAFVLKKNGFELNKKSYQGSKSRIEVKCKQGHTFTVRADNALAEKITCKACNMRKHD